MDVRDYRGCDAVRLAGLIARREVSAAEVQDAAYRALDEVNPALNALVGEPFAEPLGYARDGSFRGVPMVLKDLNAYARGVPMQSGSRLAGGGITSSDDSEVVARFRRAGLAILGRTTTPELGVCSTTEPVLTGATRNPWDLTRSTAGSSGGSAALVAARAVPIGHANDAGGSIRMPAAWCGLVGLKPSRGRTPVGPGTDPSPDLMRILVEFAVTRSIRDAAALLDAIHGAETGELCHIAPPKRPYVDEITDRPRRLRVAVAPSPPWSPRPVGAECHAAVEDVARQVGELGHAVDLDAPAIDYATMLEAYTRLTSVLLARSVDAMAAQAGLDPASGLLEATIASYARLGRTLSGMDVCAAQSVLIAARRSIGTFFQDHDILLTPTMTDPACLLGTIDANDPKQDAYTWQQRSFYYGPFAWPFNVTGQPAISLPTGESSAGLPIGVQMIGRLGEDGTVLAVASLLEEALPWRDRMPPTVVGKPSQSVHTGGPATRQEEPTDAELAVSSSGCSLRFGKPGRGRAVAGGAVWSAPWRAIAPISSVDASTLIKRPSRECETEPDHYRGMRVA